MTDNDNVLASVSAVTAGGALSDLSALFVGEQPVPIPDITPQASGGYAFTLYGRVDRALREAGWVRVTPFWRAMPDEIVCEVRASRRRKAA